MAPVLFTWLLFSVFVLGFVLLAFVPPIGLIVIGLGGLLVAKSLKRIPADPPHVGILTIWGKRTKEIKREGYLLLAPFFPFFIDVILVNVEKRNTDFEFRDVRCRRGGEDIDRLSRKEIKEIVLTRGEDSESENVKKIIDSPPESGGAVTVQVSVTWEVDSGDQGGAIAFRNAKGQKGVENILRDVLGEDIRQIGKFITWEQFAFAQDFVTVRLISDITGNTPDDKTSADLRRSEAREIRGDYSENEIQKFLTEYIQNGLSTLADLGIKIRRLNVVNVEPEGDLKQDAERGAREIQQRRAEEFEIGTLTKLVGILKSEMPDASEEFILDAVQAERNKLRKFAVSAPTVESLVGILTRGSQRMEETEGKNNG